MSEYKQVIVVRKDLNLSVGKTAAQAAHASVAAYGKTGKIIRDSWERGGAKKVVLAVNSETELINLFEKAKRRSLPTALIKDAGMTEIPAGTVTALAIGPEKADLIDKITGELPLLS